MTDVFSGFIVALVLLAGLVYVLHAAVEHGPIEADPEGRPLWKDIVLILVLYFVIRKLLEYRHEVEN